MCSGKLEFLVIYSITLTLTATTRLSSFTAHFLRIYGLAL